MNPNPIPDALSATTPAQAPELAPTDLPPKDSIDTKPASTNELASTDELALTRAMRRKLHKLKCQGHATHGAAARYYPVSAGREAVPQPTEAEREKVFSFVPSSASQVNYLVKCMRSERVQEVTDEQGKITRIVFKPATRDEALLLTLQVEVLKPAKRDDYVDQLLNYFMAPNGLGREDHQRTRVLLERMTPRHILDLAHNYKLQVWQDFIAEANEAWTDPVKAQLALYEGEVPARPKVKDANDCIAALSERCALLPEPFRLVLKDLIRILSDCQSSKLHDCMEMVKGLLTLSSKDLIAALIELGQHIVQEAGIDFLIHPKEFEAANGDLRKRLQALMIVPKTKKSTLKKVALKQSADKNASAKRNAAQAKRAAPQAQATPQTQAAPQQTTPNVAAQTPVTTELSSTTTDLTPVATELKPVASELNLEAAASNDALDADAEAAAESAVLSKTLDGTEFNPQAQAAPQQVTSNEAAQTPVTTELSSTATDLTPATTELNLETVASDDALGADAEAAADSAVLSEAPDGTEFNPQAPAAPQQATSNAAAQTPVTTELSSTATDLTPATTELNLEAAASEAASGADAGVAADSAVLSEASVGTKGDPQAPADAQSTPSAQAANAWNDPNQKWVVDPNGRYQVAIDDSLLRAREAARAELAQRRALKQKESRRKHNKEVRKQRKTARSRK